MCLSLCRVGKSKRSAILNFDDVVNLVCGSRSTPGEPAAGALTTANTMHANVVMMVIGRSLMTASLSERIGLTSGFGRSALPGAMRTTGQNPGRIEEFRERLASIANLKNYAGGFRRDAVSL